MGFALACLLLPAAALGHPELPTGNQTVGPPRLATLSKKDRDFLNGLIKEFLFDPRGALRVRVSVPVWCVPGRYRETLDPSDRKKTETRAGWLVVGRGEQTSRVYFTDGFSIPAPEPEKVELIDFVAECRKRYGASGPAKRHRTAVDWIEVLDPDLAMAAWLCRIGHDGLAARALTTTSGSGDKDPRAELRETLADRAYGGLHDAFCLRADADALAHGERLLRLYPDFVETGHPQATAIVDDLKRRRCSGAFDRPATGVFPPGFRDWSAKKKRAYLIESLDEIALVKDASAVYFRYRSHNRDARFDEIIKQGDAIIPSLIDVVQNDNRLSRCPELGGRFATPTGQIVTVREIARDAILKILRVNFLEPTSDAKEDHDPLIFADLARKYWDTYGKLAFDERMMKVLTDSASHEFACREAAINLAQYGAFNGDGWSRTVQLNSRAPRKQNSAVTRFKSPTASEGILAAMNRNRAKSGKDRGDAWESIEESYLCALEQLGDARAAHELARLAAEAKNASRQRRIALACHQLGLSGPLIRFVRQVEAGTLILGPDSDESHRDPSNIAREVTQVAKALAECGHVDADRALYSLATPDHPWHELVKDSIVHERERYWHDLDVDVHPFCLEVLRRALDDTQRTGVHYYLRGDEVEKWSALDDRRRSRRSSDHLTDRVPRVEHAEERVCDVAAMQMTKAVFGAPDFHPLYRDADAVIAELKEFSLRHGRNVCRLTWFESDRLGVRRSYPAYVPDLKPLRRPATTTDVARGTAVFTLDGIGKVPEGRLPRWLQLKANPGSRGERAVNEHYWIGSDGIITRIRNDRDAPIGLVAQAEVGHDGKVVYGVIFRHSIRTIRADEVERIEPHERK